MIYTLTTNPSIDYYIYLNDQVKKGINRSSKYDFIAAGKGVNVSRVLSNLGQKNTCVLTAGGFTGEYIKDQLSLDNNIEVIMIPIAGNSRINVKIRCAGDEVDLNTSGPEVTEEKKKELVLCFSKVKKNDYVCINGSLQSGMKETIFEIADIVNRNGGRLILDVPNISFDEILRCKPYLIKPNDDEIRQFLSTDRKFPELAYEIKERIAAKEINCLLSLGAEGSCYISKDRIVKVKCPNVTAINTVGAGDSLLAGFVYMLENGNPIEKCLSFASATGSAAVTKEELPTQVDIYPLVEQVVLEEL